MELAVIAVVVLALFGGLASSRPDSAGDEAPDPPSTPPSPVLGHQALAAPLVRVSELQHGAYMAVTGRLVGTTTLKAPLSGRRCAAYELEIYRGDDLVTRMAAADAVAVVTTGGEVRLDGRQASVRLPPMMPLVPLDSVRRGRKLLARLNLPKGSYLAWESTVAEGEDVVVIGYVHAEGAGIDGGAFRTSPGPRRLVPGDEPLIITTPRPQRPT